MLNNLQKKNKVNINKVKQVVKLIEEYEKIKVDKQDKGTLIV